MTREEAITQLDLLLEYCESMMTSEYPVWRRDCEALRMLIAALRPVSREQVEKAWMGCKYCDEEWGTCDPITNRFAMPPRGGIRFCPVCGRPLTDEAVQIEWADKVGMYVGFGTSSYNTYLCEYDTTQLTKSMCTGLVNELKARLKAEWKSSVKLGFQVHGERI